MTAPVVDVMAVLADMQQQLTDLTHVVEAQQRTLRHLLERDATAASAECSKVAEMPSVR